MPFNLALRGRWKSAAASCLSALALLTVSISPAGCEDDGQWKLWTRYAAHFIDAQGRVIDRSSSDRSTSEGQSYAMFFAVVADDRVTFDRLLGWAQNNLAAGDLKTHLPAWHWGKDKDGTWRPLDANSASDADVWMTYALLEAGQLWSEPRYRDIGMAMLGQIEKKEVASLPGLGPMLLPGPDGFHIATDVWVVNPSYLPLPVIRAFARANPAGPWKAMVRAMPQLYKQGSPHGFPMDWVTYTLAGGFQPSPAPWEQPGTPAIGSYDAIRVYLWTGLSQAETPDLAIMLGSIDGMATFLGHHLNPPETVNADGAVVREDGGVGFSAALIPYLAQSGRRASANVQQARLEAHLDQVLGLYENDPRYYDQNLALFALGWTEHRYSFDVDGKLRVRWKR